jgi:hypothetical protein
MSEIKCEGYKREGIRSVKGKKTKAGDEERTGR